jgi:hypothetical protein
MTDFIPTFWNTLTQYNGKKPYVSRVSRAGCLQESVGTPGAVLSQTLSRISRLRNSPEVSSFLAMLKTGLTQNLMGNTQQSDKSPKAIGVIPKTPL